MPVLIGLAGLAFAVLYWMLRTHTTVKAVKELNQDTKGLQRQVKSGIQRLIGTKLERISDPRLGAVILMIQLVRTGSPVTAQEKTQILELMESPLGIADISAMFERAWAYTTPRLFFSSVADELTPMLREKLDLPERLQLVAMLAKVAGAYHGASDLQAEAVARLKTRLTRG